MNNDGEISVTVDGVSVPDAFPLLSGDGSIVGGAVRLDDGTLLFIAPEGTPQSQLTELHSAVSSAFAVGTPTQAITVNAVGSNSLASTGTLQYSDGVNNASPPVTGIYSDFFEGKGNNKHHYDVAFVVSFVLSLFAFL